MGGEREGEKEVGDSGKKRKTWIFVGGERERERKKWATAGEKERTRYLSSERKREKKRGGEGGGGGGGGGERVYHLPGGSPRVQGSWRLRCLSS